MVALNTGAGSACFSKCLYSYEMYVAAAANPAVMVHCVVVVFVERQKRTVAVCGLGRCVQEATCSLHASIPGSLKGKMTPDAKCVCQ